MQKVIFWAQTIFNAFLFLKNTAFSIISKYYYVMPALEIITAESLSAMSNKVGDFIQYLSIAKCRIFYIIRFVHLYFLHQLILQKFSNPDIEMVIKNHCFCVYLCVLIWNYAWLIFLKALWASLKFLAEAIRLWAEMSWCFQSLQEPLNRYLQNCS